MDIAVRKGKKVTYRLIKEFEPADVIPYFISLLMLLGIIYFVLLFKSLLLTTAY
jgi:hypothetical protein